MHVPQGLEENRRYSCEFEKILFSTRNLLLKVVAGVKFLKVVAEVKLIMHIPIINERAHNQVAENRKILKIWCGKIVCS